MSKNSALKLKFEKYCRWDRVQTLVITKGKYYGFGSVLCANPFCSNSPVSHSDWETASCATFRSTSPHNRIMLLHLVQKTHCCMLNSRNQLFNRDLSIAETLLLRGLHYLLLDSSHCLIKACFTAFCPS